jgi:hypothetical protein
MPLAATADIAAGIHRPGVGLCHPDTGARSDGALVGQMRKTTPLPTATTETSQPCEQ